jgi:RHS repeat-associated protein
MRDLLFPARAVVVVLTLAMLLASSKVNAQQVVEYVHFDALGSPAVITNQAGAVVERLDYEPYGSLIGKPDYQGVAFTGHVQDAATGLTYMQQRYYDPQVGLFLSVDPLTAYSNPVGYFHRYRYAENNPYSLRDPDGRQNQGCEDCRTYGKAQSSSKTPTHASTSQRIANEIRASGLASSVHLNQRLTTVTGNPNAPRIQPDVTAVMKTNHIDMVEVRSMGQTTAELEAKLAAARAQLGVPGKNIVIDPDPVVRSSPSSMMARGLGAFGIFNMIFHEITNGVIAKKDAEAEARRQLENKIQQLEQKIEESKKPKWDLDEVRKCIDSEERCA